MMAVQTHKAAMLSPATDCTNVDSEKLLVLFSTKAEPLIELRSSTITDVLSPVRPSGIAGVLLFSASVAALVTS